MMYSCTIDLCRLWLAVRVRAAPSLEEDAGEIGVGVRSADDALDEGVSKSITGCRSAAEASIPSPTIFEAACNGVTSFLRFAETTGRGVKA